MKNGRALEVLDHGYIKLIECWGTGVDGSDRALKDFEVGIIEAARMSTNKGFNGWIEDEKLLSYLYKNKHMTPFEMSGAILEIKAPIFVFREWHRHRTQFYNEMSARYIPLPNENYLPHASEIVARSAIAAVATNRQATGTGVVANQDEVEGWLIRLNRVYKEAQAVYDEGLQLGVPKELARLSVPVARYSRMRAGASLRNWLAFLTLRMDPKAQWEIRQYANAVHDILATYFPKTMDLFLNGSK